MSLPELHKSSFLDESLSLLLSTFDTNQETTFKQGSVSSVLDIKWRVTWRTRGQRRLEVKYTVDNAIPKGQVVPISSLVFIEHISGYVKRHLDWTLRKLCFNLVKKYTVCCRLWSMYNATNDLCGMLGNGINNKQQWSDQHDNDDSESERQCMWTWNTWSSKGDPCSVSIKHVPISPLLTTTSGSTTFQGKRMMTTTIRGWWIMLTGMCTCCYDTRNVHLNSRGSIAPFTNITLQNFVWTTFNPDAIMYPTLYQPNKAYPSTLSPNCSIVLTWPLSSTRMLLALECLTRVHYHPQVDSKAISKWSSSLIYMEPKEWW